MPAKVIPVGEPANDSERRAIGTLRDGLPNGYFVLHNFEIRANNQVYEIDLAVVAPHCVYVVDVKGTRGNIEVYGSKWYPEHHGPYPSPLAKLRQHAKVLKSLICETTPTKQELKRIYVHAVVLLTADTAKLNDPQQKDGADVIDLKNCLNYFQNQSMIPAHFANDIRSLHAPIFKALNAQAKPNSAPLRFRDWQIEQKLGGTDRYTDYRARRQIHLAVW